MELPCHTPPPPGNRMAVRKGCMLSEVWILEVCEDWRKCHICGEAETLDLLKSRTETCRGWSPLKRVDHVPWKSVDHLPGACGWPPLKRVDYLP